MMPKQVFISYSWDSEEHKSWVKEIADSLISNGIVVFLDQYDIMPGQSVTQFMETSISKSDFVLVILTPNYKTKSVERKGGVGYEQQIISGEIMSGIDRKKFIPIIKQGDFTEGLYCSIPPHFKGISTLDFRKLEEEKTSLNQLLRAIYNEPKLVKPPLGDKPDFKNLMTQRSFIIELDEKFNCLQSEIVLTDLFLQISDLRRLNEKYSLSFYIRGITDEAKEYFQLNSLQNLSEDDIKRKVVLRHYLNQKFFFSRGGYL